MPAAPLDIPIIALHGTKDELVARNEMMAWREVTASTLSLFGGRWPPVPGNPSTLGARLRGSDDPQCDAKSYSGSLIPSTAGGMCTPCGRRDARPLRLLGMAPTSVALQLGTAGPVLRWFQDGAGAR